MSRRTVWIDDLDGESEGARHITFALEGVTYDIDLTEEHLQELRDVIAPFIDKAQAREKAGPKSEMDRIRVWGRANGYECSRGRISKKLREAYEALGPDANKEN
jgi:hypothetical protein